MLCQELDSQLGLLADENDIAYTRYADDITFSSSLKPFPNHFLTSVSPLILSKSIHIIVKSNGFLINNAKSHLIDNCHSQYVTGIKVNSKLNLSRLRYCEIRAMLHAYLRFGNDRCVAEYSLINHRKIQCSFYNLIRSKISFFEMVRGKEDPLAHKLKLRLNDIHYIYASGILEQLREKGLSFSLKLGIKFYFINIFDYAQINVGTIWKRRSDYKGWHKVDGRKLNTFFTDIEGLPISSVKYYEPDSGNMASEGIPILDGDDWVGFRG